MKECRLCKKPLEAEDAVCVFCGYDPKTDTVNFAFKEQQSSIEKAKAIEKKIKREAEKKEIGPGVKKFALFGIAILIFSILYRYNFDVSLATADIRFFFAKLMGGKISAKIDKKKDKKNEKLEWINVKTFKSQKKIDAKKLVVEGIFFDSKSGNYAVINGEVIAEGETVDNITVKKINKDSVEVIAGGEVKVLQQQ
ncbi:MAG: hypothetical protein NC916_00530 [Candidatus Omnitrophica bacterium]|nr:hypothetical protein [Candidatus Omnitrophota bacterium]